MWDAHPIRCIDRPTLPFPYNLDRVSVGFMSNTHLLLLILQIHRIGNLCHKVDQCFLPFIRTVTFSENDTELIAIDALSGILVARATVRKII